MTNRIETARDYPASLVNRTLGRTAWINADHQKPLYALLEFMLPATSRVFMSGRQHPEKYAKYPAAIRYGIMGAALAVDIALLGAATYISLNNKQNSFIRDWGILKVNFNMGTHAGLDIVGAAAKRVRNFRPSGTTLAI